MSEADNLSLTITRGELRSMIEDAWTDDASSTGFRLLALIDAKINGTPHPFPKMRYVHGLWGHIFEGDSLERETRFAYDREKNEVIHLEIKRNHKWVIGSRSEREDLLDSLENANSEALAEPAAWDLEQSAELPDWARATGDK